MTAGRRGEDAVIEYLVNLGYKIIRRNWRYSHLEVDIIVSHDKGIAFVEVKSRSSRAFGYPESFVNGNKQRLLKRAANAYAHIHKHDGEIRFDIAAVSLDQNGVVESIRYFEDAFY